MVLLLVEVLDQIVDQVPVQAAGLVPGAQVLLVGLAQGVVQVHHEGLVQDEGPAPDGGLLVTIPETIHHSLKIHNRID